ncbi:MAG: Asparaginase, partial [Actinomycetota bacterium]
MTPESAVPIAATFRNDILESIHHGVMVILDQQGNVEVAIGDCETVVFPRSSLKPLQAFAMIRQGLELPDESMALVCASHNGTALHCSGVQQILQLAGLNESYLANTPDLPLGQNEAEEILRSGGTRTSVQQNCSGKHAGMLATCQLHGWPTDESYLSMDHPLQKQISSGIEFLAAERVSAI